MRIVCIGGGPAGLYFAICAKRRDAGHEVTVLDRDPRGATYGWGVGYWDNLLDLLFTHDRESAVRVRTASAVWNGRQVQLPGQPPAYMAGYGYTINRSTLLEILTQRALDLGVEVRHEHQVEDTADLPDADLVVASDGSNSLIRNQNAEAFGTHSRLGHNRYIWLGTTKRFTHMTFTFERTDAGWIWFYGYPSAPGISTCVVECGQQTWQDLGLADDNGDSGLRTLQRIFNRTLDGHGLISRDRGRPARWAQYRDVSNLRWRHENIVLLGDAAHTVHFTMGSGTGLAMTDAAELAINLYHRSELSTGLDRYERRRRAPIRRMQAGGRTSMAWFENVSSYLDRDTYHDPVDLAYALSTRYRRERPWQHLAHQARQIPAIQHGQRGYDTTRRWYLARRRGEPTTPRGWPGRGSEDRRVVIEAANHLEASTPETQ